MTVAWAISAVAASLYYQATAVGSKDSCDPGKKKIYIYFHKYKTCLEVLRKHIMIWRSTLLLPSCSWVGSDVNASHEC